MKERSLVLFTLLAQMAVGAFIISVAIYWQIIYFFGVYSGSQVLLPAFVFAEILFVIGLVASLFHLGSPTNAWRALGNLRHSWLSREVLFAILFAILVGFYILFQWFGFSSPNFRMFLALLAAVCGIALVYCMARVYMLRTVRWWNSWLTIVSFFATAFILGGLVDGAILAVSSVSMPFELASAGMAVLHRIGSLCIFLLLVEFLLIPLGLARLTHPDLDISLGRPVSQVYLLRMVPLFLGVATAGVLFFSAVPLDFFEAVAAIVAFCMVLFSETLGRVIFYAGRQPRM